MDEEDYDFESDREIPSEDDAYDMCQDDDGEEIPLFI